MSEAFREFAALRAEPINLESAKKVVAANDKLMEACKAYSQARRGAVSSSGRERLAVIDSLFSYQDSLNIDQMRMQGRIPGEMVKEKTGKEEQKARPRRHPKVIIGKRPEKQAEAGSEGERNSRT